MKKLFPLIVYLVLACGIAVSVSSGFSNSVTAASPVRWLLYYLLNIRKWFDTDFIHYKRHTKLIVADRYRFF